MSPPKCPETFVIWYQLELARWLMGQVLGLFRRNYNTDGETPKRFVSVIYIA